MGTDADLVAAAVSGDRDAFTELYHRHRSAVTGFLTRSVGDPDLAEDLAQEAFITALRNLGSLRVPDRFRPWLFTIAHRAAVDHLRRGVPVPVGEVPEPPTPAESTHDAAAARESARLVWEAAAALEPRQRAILELTVGADLSTGELARALDVRPAHAAVLAHRARAALGNSVRLLLLARNPRRCRRLGELVPPRPRALSRAQRASVDRHVRRCSECGDLVRALTAPLAVLGVLIAAWDRGPTPSATSGPAKGAALAGVAAVVVAVAVWVVPERQPPPVLALPAPTTTAVTTARATTTPPPVTTTTTPVATTTTTRTPEPTEPERLIAALNDARAGRGCAPLRRSPALMSAARAHAADMMRREYIAMESPEGATLADRAAAQGGPAVRGGLVAAYRETGAEMADALLSGDGGPGCDVTSIGVGRAVGGECGFYWAVVFGGD